MTAVLIAAAALGVLAAVLLVATAGANRRDDYIVDPERQADLIREDKKAWVWIAGGKP